MIRRLRHRVVAIWTAAHAGWIASNCTYGCRIDDESETIVSCIFHLDQIERLSKANDRAYRASHT